MRLAELRLLGSPYFPQNHPKSAAICYTACYTALCNNRLETRMDTGFEGWPVAPHQPPQVIQKNLLF